VKGTGMEGGEEVRGMWSNLEQKVRRAREMIDNYTSSIRGEGKGRADSDDSCLYRMS
jgi:hypothetical protein